MRRGEVRWYQFSKPDKRRPVVILTRDSALAYLIEATVAPITRTIRNIPSEVVLSDADQMPEDCAINLDHVQTVAKAKLGPVIATLSQERMGEVRRAIVFALGF